MVSHFWLCLPGCGLGSIVCLFLSLSSLSLFLCSECCNLHTLTTRFKFFITVFSEESGCETSVPLTRLHHFSCFPAPQPTFFLLQSIDGLNGDGVTCIVTFTGVCS